MRLYGGAKDAIIMPAEAAADELEEEERDHRKRQRKDHRHHEQQDDQQPAPAGGGRAPFFSPEVKNPRAAGSPMVDPPEASHSGSPRL